MNSVILQFLFGIASAGVGFFVGLSLSWREYKLGGRRVAAPSLPRSDKQQAMWLMVVAALSVASAAYAGVQASEQSSCNSDFKQSIVTRSAITAENQRHLDAMIDAIAETTTTPGPEARERARAAIADYREWSTEAARQRAANPLADPVCGG